MLSDDELLNHDASDSLFIRETPREDSPRTFTRHLINRFGLSSKGGTETVTNNTQSVLTPKLAHSISTRQNTGSTFGKEDIPLASSENIPTPLNLLIDHSN